MNRLIRTVLMKAAIPALALGTVLALAGPSVAFAQRNGHSGHSTYSGRAYAGGGGHAYAAPRGRSYSGGGRAYAAPSYAGRGYYGGGRAYVGRGGGYYPGRFYAGRGYYYGGSFWARPYFGYGIGIPFGYGYYSNSGCGYYDGWGNWIPAPCYPNVDQGY